MLRKLQYRSGQRGFLELDLMLGTWAKDNLHSLSHTELELYSNILEEEVPDVFKWLTGQEEPPERMASNQVFARVLQHVAKKHEVLDRNGARTPGGAEWLRGWADLQTGTRYPGNQ